MVFENSQRLFPSLTKATDGLLARVQVNAPPDLFFRQS